MDTRRKLKGGAEIATLLRSETWTAVVGLFDPLTLEQARRLESIESQGRRVVAIVLEDEAALLPAATRAQMIAALRSVAAAAVAKREQWREWMPLNPGLEIEFDAEAERRRSEDFRHFVLSRQEHATAGGKGT